jgi:peroxiredoxin
MNRSIAVIAAPVAVVALVALAQPASADERPPIGGPAPLPAVHDLSGSPRSLKELVGRRGMVVLFWALWSDRSVEELRRLDAAAGEMAEHGVAIAAVNVDRFALDAAEAGRLQSQVDRLGLHVPVLVDRGLELFHAYGVVTVPSTAVIDRNGHLAYFLYGYSHEQREALFDAIDAVAGVARPAPAAADVPKAAPAAIRRLQLGRLQLQQGHVEPARSSFEESIKADAAFSDPLVELAALALDANDAAGARSLLDRAAAVHAGDPGVQRERARLAALDGQLVEARTALEQLTASGGGSIASAYLGYLLHAAGDRAKADTALDRAKEMSGVDPRVYLRQGDTAADTVWRAMIAFRREVAAGRR